jgi:hypothetical protein
MRSLGQPEAGPVELQPGQQRCRLVRRCGHFPVGQVLIQLLLADQELPRAVQPGPQQRPLAQQRLVRHLDDAGLAVLAQDQQPRLGQTLEQTVRSRRQVIPARRPADVFACVVHPHHGRHEGLAQRGHLLAIRRRRRQHAVGCLAHRVLERRQAGLRIAQGLVFGQAELLVLARTVMQLAQREGEQRQRILGLRIADRLLHHLGLDLQAGDPGRALDDLRDPSQRHRPEREFLEPLGQSRSGLQHPKEVGADRHDRDNRQVGRQRLAEDFQEAARLIRVGRPEQLLRLVNRQQDLRLVCRRLDPQRAGHVAQHRHRIAGQQSGLQGAPVCTRARRDREAARKLVDWAGLRPQGRQHDPVTPVALEARDHAGAQQRRLAGAGSAEQREQPNAALRPPGVEPLDQPADLVVAAEIERRILLWKASNPG